MATPAKSTVSSLKLKSVDGTGYSLRTDSFSDYFLHPVFLRFFFAAIAIYMLVDDDLVLADASLWRIAANGLGVVAVTLTWLWIGFGLLRMALRRGYRITLYTPVALVPLAVLIELAAQLANQMMTGLPAQGMGAAAEAVVLDIAVILVFDILHAHFVVPAHPQGVPAHTQPAPAPIQPVAQAAPAARRDDPVTVIDDEEDAPPAPAAQSIPKIGPVATLLRVGTRQIDIEDILMVRTEDHYLGIVTRTGKTLQRAKLSDLPELHASRLGMQINRSVWVAFAAIREMTENDRGQITLKLTTGDEEVVAKPRVFAFRQFYRPDAA